MKIGEEKIVKEIIGKWKEFCEFKRHIERAKRMVVQKRNELNAQNENNTTNSQKSPRNTKSRKDVLSRREKAMSDLNINKEYTEQKNIKQLKIKDKSLMKLYHLNEECLIVASTYFDSLNDFMNLELGCRRFRNNLDSLLFNPIPIDKSTRSLY